MLPCTPSPRPLAAILRKAGCVAYRHVPTAFFPVALRLIGDSLTGQGSESAGRAQEPSELPNPPPPCRTPPENLVGFLRAEWWGIKSTQIFIGSKLPKPWDLITGQPFSCAPCIKWPESREGGLDGGSAGDRDSGSAVLGWGRCMPVIHTYLF